MSEIRIERRPITPKKRPKAKRKRAYIPNRLRAPDNGFYAVIIAGRRCVLEHRSGEPLKGSIAA